MKSADFMDAARARLGLDSDNKLAKHFGIDQGRISSFRRGRREFTEEIALEFARVLDVDAGWILAEIKAASEATGANIHYTHNRAWLRRLARRWRALTRPSRSPNRNRPWSTWDCPHRRRDDIGNGYWRCRACGVTGVYPVRPDWQPRVPA